MNDVVGADVYAVVVILFDPGEEVVGVLDAGANNGWIWAIRSALVPVASSPRREQWR